jgi:hypothetical protein
MRSTAKNALNTGVKNDEDKLPMGLIPVESKRGLAAVLAHGAHKYEPHNWRRGMAWSRLIDAAYRHLDAFNAGEDIDDGPGGSGLPHIDHLQACASFLSSYFHTDVGIDDRYRAPAKREERKP